MICIPCFRISEQLLDRYTPYAGAAGMESSQWEHCNHLFCREVSLLSDPHCQFRGVGQDMKQI